MSSQQRTGCLSWPLLLEGKLGFVESTSRCRRQ